MAETQLTLPPSTQKLVAPHGGLDQTYWTPLKRAFDILNTLRAAFESTSAGLGTAATKNIATVEDVRSAADGDKVLVAEQLQTAAESVSLADPGTIDWHAAVNWDLTIADDVEIGNPTNAIPGTYRTLIVQGDDATERTITFGDQYGGEPPEIEDCTSTKWYEITIRCVTATHFLVSARDASPPA